jgi:hypothetical protein
VKGLLGEEFLLPRGEVLHFGTERMSPKAQKIILVIVIAPEFM